MKSNFSRLVYCCIMSYIMLFPAGNKVRGSLGEQYSHQWNLIIDTQMKDGDDDSPPIDITMYDACSVDCRPSSEAEADNLVLTREEMIYAPVCGVGSSPDDNVLSQCTIHCNDDQITMKYNGAGLWLEIVNATRIHGENDFAWQNRLPVCIYEMDTEQPCERIEMRQDGTLVCGGNYSVTASARIPCVEVRRWPYPRGLVSMENEFEVLGPFEALGSISSKEWCGDVRNYRLQVGWFMRSDQPPLWFFDERDWADEPNEDFGMRVTHTYQTSSWGLPENGPSLEGELILPAYQVRVGTAWQPYVRRSWQTYERGERRTFACEAGERACEILFRQCEDPGTDREHEDCFEWDWVTHDTGWQAIDLRSHGSFFTYYLSFQAVDITQPPPDFPPVPMAQRTCGDIAVPVIEIQVLLNAPEVTWEE